MFKGLTLFVFLGVSGTALAQDTSAPLNFVSCKACHGSGEGDGAIPAIQGRPYEELSTALKSFSQADDTSTVMHKFVTGLTEVEIETLAQYVSSLEGTTQ